MPQKTSFGRANRVFPDRERLFELIRFSVPIAWSDWGVGELVDRILAEEPDGRTMPAGLTYEERRQYHLDGVALKRWAGKTHHDNLA